MPFFQKEDLDKIKRDFLDPLTGLNNKSSLFYITQHILRQFERYEENWSMIIFSAKKDENIRIDCSDISQNEIDKAIAEKLKEITRRSDILFRCSDGIFCILTRVFEGDDIVMFCNKIKNHLLQLKKDGCSLEIKPKFGITFSKMPDTTESFAERSFDALNKAIKENQDIVVET
ncbi:GGDEF domain-containing protein [Hippea jasoniae]|uniref:GGDEF domain-containing protein n=1 Tax=Hippea jasoniae TaxID=944479 RepID=UPI000551236C|nr:diguanylate cyclase [Hippea jasoniae]